MAFCSIFRAWGGHFLNLFLNLRSQSTIKFGEILLLVGTKRTNQWKLCPKLEGPIGALPQIWWKWLKGAPVRLYSNFLQKSLSSCRCFDRHQVGFTNCILLNEIFDILVGSIACKSAINAICNQRHLLVSIWIMTWRRAPIGPSILCQPIGVFPQIWWSTVVLSSRTDFGICPPQALKIEQNATKPIQKLVDICGRANLSRNSQFGHLFIDL